MKHFPSARLFALAVFAAPPALAANGAMIATRGAAGVPPCSTCHGAQGQGQPAAGIPRLAGLNADYIVHQLTSFVAGTRDSAVMGPIAKGLNATERRAAAAYYAQLPVAQGSKRRVDQTPKIRAGARLASRGKWSEGVPACARCHGADGSGVGSNFPRLAGQSARYIESQFKAWQTGTRHNDPMGLMKEIAAKLDGNEVSALAAYYAAMPYARPTRPARPSSRAILPATAAPSKGFTPPPDSAIPQNNFGKMVRLGENIFHDTQHYAARYVGNKLQCSNCHIDRGRLAGSAPLWAAYVAYPAYRAKNKRVNTYEERMQGCFRFSMNGKPPRLGSKTLVALQAYSYFLAKGAPVGTDLPGRGYPRLAKPAQPFSYARGENVYNHNCALCHGANGQGQLSAAGKLTFPPLWGAHSYNWGAGMGSIKNAADFVKANMPLGQGGMLSDQQAWDVAAFIDSQERPQDPRFTGSVSETRRKFHSSPMSMYGRTINGIRLGTNSPPVGPP